MESERLGTGHLRGFGGSSMATTWLRYLFLRLSAEELRGVPWRVYLGPALVVTWLAGMGRYWDHPSASGLQILGIGSIVYVFVLALVLWIGGGWLGARQHRTTALTSS